MTDQIHRIADKEPEFWPCFMWHIASKRWTRITGGMSLAWYAKNYSHWCDSPTAPEVRPDAPPSTPSPAAISAAREILMTLYGSNMVADANGLCLAAIITKHFPARSTKPATESQAQMQG